VRQVVTGTFKVLVGDEAAKAAVKKNAAQL